MRSLFLGLFLLLAAAAHADLKVSLVTISPGAELFEAFGHTALIVEDTERPGFATYYAYGQVNTGEIVTSPRPQHAFQKLFDNQISTRIQNETSAVSAEHGVPETLLNLYYFKTRNQRVQNPATGQFEFVATKEPRATKRVTTINELALTQEQATRLVAKVKADIAAGFYFYHNFNNNCATRVRDVLFDDAILGSGAREKLAAERVNASFNDLGMLSMDEAVAQNGSMYLVPADKKNNPRIQQSLSMMGLSKLEYASAKEFYETVINMQKTLEGYRGSPLLAYAKMDDAKLDALLRSMNSYFFDASYATAPITRYQSLFLPKNLRTALAETGAIGANETTIIPSENGPIVKKRTAGADNRQDEASSVEQKAPAQIIEAR